MTIRTRRTIFYLLVCIFFVASTLLIFYSNGWRFDFETKRIDKLGGLYFEATPGDLTLKVEKTSYQMKSGFLKNTLLIDKLFPKTYAVEISRMGYQSWYKRFIVHPSLVKAVYPIVLVPTQPTLQLFAQKVIDIWPGSKYTIFKDQQKQLHLNNQIISGDHVLDWSPNGTSALLANKTNQTLSLLDINFLNATTTTPIALSGLRADEKISTAIFDPTDSTYLLIATNRNLYHFNLEQSLLTRMDQGVIQKLTRNDQAVFWFNQKWQSFPNEFHNRDVIMQILEQSDFAHAQVMFQVSPDQKKIALLNLDNPTRIHILFLEEDAIFQKKTGELYTFTLPFSTETPQYTWHSNSSYLFLQTHNQLQLTEIDNALPQNFQTIATNTQDYQLTQENLYILRSGDVYTVDLK